MTDNHRVFCAERLVRLGDVTASGRLRLDAVARYLQDVATDDAADAGLADRWVLRRTALRITTFPAFRDRVELATWCSGVATSAAERRTAIRIDGVPAVEAEALWVFVGPDGRPARLDKDQFAIWGAGTQRRISTRLRHPDLLEGADLACRSWPLRVADVDVLAHVNNAVSLAAVEDLLVAAGVAETPVPWWVEVEYRRAIDPTKAPDLVWTRAGGGVLVGGLRCGTDLCTTFRLGVAGTLVPPVDSIF